jgi:hypothetical protein
MKIWKLELEVVDGSIYDVAFGFVIMAETKERARILASRTCGDEGKEPWLDSKLSSCKEVKLGKTERIILRDYNAG